MRGNTAFDTYDVSVLQEVNWIRRKSLIEIQTAIHSNYPYPRTSVENIEYIISQINDVFLLGWKNNGTALTLKQETVFKDIKQKLGIKDDDDAKEKVLDLIEGVLRFTPRTFVPLSKERG